MPQNIVELSKPEGLAFFVGDIHGQYDLLMETLDEVGFEADKGHVLFSVGDLIDRGPKNMECLKLLDEPWFYAVRGNHEDFMIKTVLHDCRESENMWAYNGGGWAGAYYKKEPGAYRFEDELVTYARKLEEAPYIREVQTAHSNQKIAIVHAEIPRNFNYKELITNNPNQEIKANDLEALIWQRTLASQLGRNLFAENIGEFDGCRFLKSRDDYAYPTKELVADVIISGHTPMSKPVLVGRNLFIDTGAARGSKPTILNEIEVKNILSQYRDLSRKQEPNFGF